MAKRKKAMKFPEIFKEKVDLGRVNREQIKAWAAAKLVELFSGLEDEVLINYVNAFLDQESIDPQDMLISINDMLERDAEPFMAELWELLVQAQKEPTGIPPSLIQAARADVRKRYDERDRVSHGMRHNSHHKHHHDRTGPFDGPSRDSHDRRDRRDGQDDYYRRRDYHSRDEGRYDRYDRRDGRSLHSGSRREDYGPRRDDYDNNRRHRDESSDIDPFGRDARPVSRRSEEESVERRGGSHERGPSPQRSKREDDYGRDDSSYSKRRSQRGGDEEEDYDSKSAKRQ